MRLLPLLLPFGSWIVAFLLAWLAGRPLTRWAHGRPGRLVLVSAAIAGSAILPVVAFAAFSLPPIAAISAIVLSMLSLIFQIALVRPVRRFRGDRSAPPACTDPGVLASVAGIARRLGIAPPPAFQWNSMTSSLMANAFTFGLQAPSIVVTDGILHRLSAAERDAILAHELAHLARGTLRLIAGMAPVAALAGFALSLVAPIWVAVAGMLATYVLLRTVLGRRDEIGCDLLAAKVVGYPTIAAALEKIHAAHAIPGNTGLSMLAHAIATHPHRATRLAALRQAAPDAGRANIPDESGAAKRHRMAALVARLTQGTAYVAAIVVAPTRSGLAAGLFLALALMPAIAIIAASWRRTRSARRLMRFPMVAGTWLVLVGLFIIAAAVLIPHSPGSHSQMLVLAGELAGILLLLVGTIRARPIRRRRQAVAAAFQSGDYAGARAAALEKPRRASRDAAVRHTAAFAAARLGDRQTAVEEFVGIHREHPKARGSAIVAAALLIGRDPERALDLAETVSRALPEDPTAHLMAARALRRLGRIAEARDRIKRARATEPDDGRLISIDACLALDEGDLERARALAAEAERLAPGDAWPALARAEIALRTEPPDRAAAAVAAAEASVAAHPVALLDDEILGLKSRALVPGQGAAP